MKVPAYGDGYNPKNASPQTIVVLPLTENKRPIGFTAWSTHDETSKIKPLSQLKEAA